MDTGWSIEAGFDDPVIIVPWSNESSDSLPSMGYVDLKRDSEAIHAVTEARAWPEMHCALMALNAPGSSVWTAKCDAWMLDEAERELDFGPVAFGFGMYVDVLPSRRDVFASLTEQRALVEAWAAKLRRVAPEDARADFVIRPALWNEEAGFAVTVYVFGYGAQEAQARTNWSAASVAVSALISGNAAAEDRRYNNKDAGE